MIATLYVMDLRKTIAQLYEEKNRLDKVIASLEQLEGGFTPLTVVSQRRGRKFMSPQERQQVSERMRKYWAERKASQEQETPRVLTAASAA
ncbi:MAG TPA: hypothetical protein VMU80_28800 [Bryobacteraceae bacterium]|nr:hypothetical protein [Bryobacteraceae bacterium]